MSAPERDEQQTSGWAARDAGPVEGRLAFVEQVAADIARDGQERRESENRVGGWAGLTLDIDTLEKENIRDQARELQQNIGDRDIADHRTAQFEERLFGTGGYVHEKDQLAADERAAAREEKAMERAAVAERAELSQRDEFDRDDERERG